MGRQRWAHSNMRREITNMVRVTLAPLQQANTAACVKPVYILSGVFISRLAFRVFHFVFEHVNFEMFSSFHIMMSIWKCSLDIVSPHACRNFSRTLIMLFKCKRFRRLILVGELSPLISKVGNNWRYVSRYEGVLSLSVNFS